MATNDPYGKTLRESLTKIDKRNERRSLKKHSLDDTVTHMKEMVDRDKDFKMTRPDLPHKKPRKKKLGYLDKALQDMMRAASHEGVVLRHRMDRGKPIKIKALGEEELEYIAEHIMYHKALYRFLNSLVDKHGVTLGTLQEFIQRKTMDPNENWGRIS